MTSRHLSTLAIVALLLGQSSIVTWLSPDADAEMNPVQGDQLSQISSLFQREEAEDFQIPDDVLKAPVLESPRQKPEQLDGKDHYSFIMQEELAPVHVQVVPDPDNGPASVTVNEQEVVRFRQAVAGYDPYPRAQLLAERLSKFLSEGGNPARIVPGKQGNLVVIRMDGDMLATVDASNAEAAGTTREQLAMIWTNRIRQSLGEQVLQPSEFKELFPPAAPAAYVPAGPSTNGVASWYGGIFHGRRTASGARFNKFGLTAAHRTLPFGTLVKVTNASTHKSCVVKITDRGPFAHGRIIDLSQGAAKAIGLNGVGKVKLEVVKPNT